MRYLVLTFLPLLAILLQTTIFGAYTIKGTIPDMLLVIVIIHAFIQKPGKSTIYGFLCGLIEDLYMGRFIGINALSKGLTAYIISKLQGYLFRENLIVGIIVVFIGTILNAVCLFLLNIVVADVFHLDGRIITSIFFQSIYNMLIAVPIYMWYYNSTKKGILKPGGDE